MLLISGGDQDPNVHSFLDECAAQDLTGLVALIGEESVPALTWDIESDRLILDGAEISPAAVWMRLDVFSAIQDQHASVRANVWYETLRGWAMAHDKVRFLNRHYRGMNKLVSLRYAIEAGLKIPETLITNQFALFDHLETDNYISKPVIGGSYTQILSNYTEQAQKKDDLATYPITVQPKLIQPEMRIFGIGNTFLGFWVRSEALDYRTESATTVHVATPPPHLVTGLRTLMQRLHLDFTAADFKTDANTGELLFLEVNSSPMFAAFDAVSDSAVSKAILSWLCDEPNKI
jgi:hypothetical protein